MRVVLDTNVIIAGLYSRNGASYQLLKLAIDGELDYAISPLVALEYEGKVAEKIEEGFLQLSLEESHTILYELVENSYQVERPYVMRPLLKDVSDEKFVECAISSGSLAIVTFNKRDFPESKLYKLNIEVLTPGEFYKREVKKQ